MVETEIKAPLALMLRLAEKGDLADGWMYLPAGNVDPSVECLFLPSALDLADPESYAASCGFPREGLDSGTLADIAHWTLHQLTPEPTDEQMFRSFEYYWRFDAFLPALLAPDPPPANAVLAKLDREFYENLGAERPGTQCRHGGCDRGTVQYSVFCAAHHFESVKGRSWQGGTSMLAR